jgi:hypothetical protein
LNGNRAGKGQKYIEVLAFSYKFAAVILTEERGGDQIRYSEDEERGKGLNPRLIRECV